MRLWNEIHFKYFSKQGPFPRALQAASDPVIKSKIELLNFGDILHPELGLKILKTYGDFLQAIPNTTFIL